MREGNEGCVHLVANLVSSSICGREILPAHVVLASGRRGFVSAPVKFEGEKVHMSRPRDVASGRFFEYH